MCRCTSFRTLWLPSATCGTSAAATGSSGCSLRCHLCGGSAWQWCAATGVAGCCTRTAVVLRGDASLPCILSVHCARTAQSRPAHCSRSPYRHHRQCRHCAMQFLHNQQDLPRLGKDSTVLAIASKRSLQPRFPRSVIFDDVSEAIAKARFSSETPGQHDDVVMNVQGNALADGDNRWLGNTTQLQGLHIDASRDRLHDLQRRPSS
jgi:hypothetical protein